ncbi:LysR family transcriptional regulator [Staphylococcus croceilyticus]|uniref:LysR family transcriptional regulator n=1 Tax=Staphylococcus croceilyticus TaxID=319942 RepID=A0ABY2KJY4_9STAP|nr:LysR family transcriptional regulator [Staphylococcus croceilyticus]PNZ70643.1 LysR family transcriptional regulator [Staphylococcus croceilyticus]TGA80948.1 LysR family transcriptional regulator [Staphylococcus croceilyticus]
MNFEQLSYIKTVYEQESIVRASQLMHISQSAMSQSIASLEKELGYQLFYRSRKGTVPTKIGKQLIPRILEILEAKERLMIEIDSLQTNIVGKLKIATIPTIFHKLIPKALSHFKRDYPNVDVEVIEADREDIVSMVENNEIDLGLTGQTTINETPKNVIETSLNLISNFKLIVPSKSKLTFNDTVALEDIKDYPFVLYDRSFYHHHLRQFEQTNGELKIVFRTNNPVVLMRTVAEGLGVGIVSSLMLENEPFLNNELIEAIPLGQPFNYFINFVAVTHKERGHDMSVQTFIKYLKH